MVDIFHSSLWILVNDGPITVVIFLSSEKKIKIVLGKERLPYLPSPRSLRQRIDQPRTMYSNSGYAVPILINSGYAVPIPKGPHGKEETNCSPLLPRNWNLFLSCHSNSLIMETRMHVHSPVPKCHARETTNVTNTVAMAMYIIYVCMYVSSYRIIPILRVRLFSFHTGHKRHYDHFSRPVGPNCHPEWEVVRITVHVVPDARRSDDSKTIFHDYSHVASRSWGSFLRLRWPICISTSEPTGMPPTGDDDHLTRISQNWVIVSYRTVQTARIDLIH